RAEEAPELLLGRPRPPLRVSLEVAKRLELALCLDDPFDGGDTEGADQLVLQGGDAHVETEAFHVGAREVGAEAGSLKAPPKVALLSDVTEPRNFQVKPLRTEAIQESSDVRRAPHWHDKHTLRFEIPAAAPRECFERELVADPFNQHGRPCAGGLRRGRHAAILRQSTRGAGPLPEVRPARPGRARFCPACGTTLAARVHAAERRVV